MMKQLRNELVAEHTGAIANTVEQMSEQTITAESWAGYVGRAFSEGLKYNLPEDVELL